MSIAEFGEAKPNMKRNAGVDVTLFLLLLLFFPFLLSESLLRCHCCLFCTTHTQADTQTKLLINRGPPLWKQSHDHTGLCSRERAGEWDSTLGLLPTAAAECFSREPKPNQPDRLQPKVVTKGQRQHQGSFMAQDTVLEMKPVYGMESAACRSCYSSLL